MGRKMTKVSNGHPNEGKGGEWVVLLDESASPIGTANKALIHHESTPLHLAFSCYLFNQAGNVLVTRRALSKLTWPGVWTNSFCGHPEPGETMEDAIQRRAQEELGVGICDLRLVDPDFRYRATDPSGVVENEVCPVYKATISGDLAPRPDEVMDWAWVNPVSLAQATALTPFVFSPWMVMHISALERAEAADFTTLRSPLTEMPGT